MNLHAQKLDLIEWITKLSDNSIISRLQKIKEDYTQSARWEDELSKKEMESIRRGLKDFEEGRIHSDATARKLYERYL